MAKEKKISINAFEEAAGNQESTSVVTWNGLDITVRRRIAYKDLMSAGIVATEACFDQGGEYVPEAKDVSIRLIVLALYTNLTIPTNIDKRYEMACFSGVFEAILPAIDRYQYDRLVEAVEERIRIRTNAAVDAVVRQANSVAEAVQTLSEKFEEQFSTLLGDITPEEMNLVIRGIAEGQVNEEKVANVYKETQRSKVRTLPAGLFGE